MPNPHAEPVAWLNDDETQAWIATAGIMILLPAALDAQMQRDAGLTFFEYVVLSLLSEQPGRTLQLSDIAERASCSLSRLSHVVSRLERQGLVSRVRLPGRGRRTAATLTDAGYDHVVAAAPAHVATVRRLLIDAVTAEELDALRRIGTAVARTISPALECPSGREGTSGNR